MIAQTNIRSSFSTVGTPEEAILRAGSRKDLYQRVCDVVAEGWGFAAAAIMVAEAGHGLQYAAGAGRQMEAFGRVMTSADDGPAEAHDLASMAFYTGRSCIADDYANDERVRAWREAGLCAGIGAAAAVPLVCNGVSSGVLLFFLAGSGAMAGETINFMERLAENVAFALERFKRAAERDRLTRMVSALSASNEAILRAETREKLFKLVCDAAVLGGKFTLVLIALAVPENDFLRIVGMTGPSAPVFATVKLAATASYPEGRGLSGTAYRTKKPCICNDYLADQSYSNFHPAARQTGANSGAALPLLSQGQAVGVMFFVSADRNAFTPEFIELLERLAANVSFALENFDRADDKARAEERIRYLATHDILTDLPNRTMFNELLKFSIQAANRYQRQCAVLFIDLDRFKIINDSLGHEAGDALLVETAARLRSGVRANDIVARLGGDEFLVLLNEISEGCQVADVARHLLSLLGKPMELSGHECRVTASIGIAMFPDDGADEQILMKHADIAMYLAKAEGKNDVRFFSHDIETKSINRLTIETNLRRALERQELCLYYQPKLDVATRKIAGVEALLRWAHPEMGLLSPIQFIPLAEETGLIVPIGRWVLKTACEQNMAWQRAGLAPISMAINVSPRQFSDENLLHDIDAALASSGMDPQLLQIEITESMVMLNVEQAIKILDAIQSRGVRLAIDDFGTGYSSMSSLKRFPIDTIKIDRSFVRDLTQNAEDDAITQAIIRMGKALGLTVVAEGVETIEQDKFLRDHACDEIQGFLFSKPVSAAEMVEFMRPLEVWDRPVAGV